LVKFNKNASKPRATLSLGVNESGVGWYVVSASLGLTREP